MLKRKESLNKMTHNKAKQLENIIGRKITETYKLKKLLNPWRWEKSGTHSACISRPHRVNTISCISYCFIRSLSSGFRTSHSLISPQGHSGLAKVLMRG
ncbi:hypothetical protein GDO81_026008 [Engystomops pustulosus]|uniref:Uncharacterized protein n=1 Tax=Engystomops pustulosus TaxID=76066 RepID=A0AAV6YN57_ENGPU|nr:hypothetical protein GDO81_026008 [Engystomops pustulosus]